MILLICEFGGKAGQKEGKTCQFVLFLIEGDGVGIRVEPGVYAER